jgi:hypothetical protein
MDTKCLPPDNVGEFLCFGTVSGSAHRAVPYAELRKRGIEQFIEPDFGFGFEKDHVSVAVEVAKAFGKDFTLPMTVYLLTFPMTVYRSSADRGVQKTVTYGQDLPEFEKTLTRTDIPIEWLDDASIVQEDYVHGDHYAYPDFRAALDFLRRLALGARVANSEESSSEVVTVAVVSTKKRKRRIEEVEEPELQPAAIAKGNAASSEDDWILDSRCSHHISSDKRFFTKLWPRTGGMMGVGRLRLEIEMAGTVKLAVNGGRKEPVILTFHDVFYCPKAACNLISLAQLQRDGTPVAYDNFGFYLTVNGTGFVVQAVNGLYPLILYDAEVAAAKERHDAYVDALQHPPVRANW